MPLYLIERRYAEQIFPDGPLVDVIEKANDDEEVRWLFSFLTADRRQTYCLYEALSPEALLAAARKANLPADVIVEVKQVSPDSIRTGTAA
jgi:hypothetical protein